MKTLIHITTLLSICAFYTSAQGSLLLLRKNPKEISSLIEDNGNLKMTALRNLCKNLVDREITKHKRYPFPKRKKAFRRHVKQLCERVELKSWLNLPLGDSEVNDLYTLKLMQKSMRKKGKLDSHGIRLIDRIKMAITSLTSPLKFKRAKKIRKGKEAVNLPMKQEYYQSINELSLADPPSSPYWTNIDKDFSSRFDDLAKKKKIKPKKNMVLIFDGVSDSGSAPKVKTIDVNRDDKWSLKWGDELHTDVVGSRLFAALGFDVDHPYYRKKNSITLVFPKKEGIASNHKEMILNIKKQYKINIEAFVSEHGIVSEDHVNENPKLKEFKGLPYVRFIESAIEGRPDRVKRLGPMMTDRMKNQNRRELRGSLLAHLWIDNWDTRAENTLLTNNHLGKRKYKISGAFSDLGTSFGVKLKFVPKDFKVGLVNHFSWDILAEKSSIHVVFLGKVNSLLLPYKKATYSDLKWMAHKIAKIDKKTLKEILKKSGWPKPIRKLYFHKLASRRSQILHAFHIFDKNPIGFDRHFSYEENGITYVKDGVLVRDIKEGHPLGYLSKKGRFRNYGGKK